MIEVAAGSPTRDVVLEDLTLDANRIAYGLVGNGADFNSVMVRRCRFVNLDNRHGIALRYGRSPLIEDCLLDGAGICTAAGVYITFGFDDIRIVGSTFRGLVSRRQPRACLQLLAAPVLLSDMVDLAECIFLDPPRRK